MKGERDRSSSIHSKNRDRIDARWTVLFRVNPVIDWIGRCAKQSPRHREFPSTRGQAEEEEEWWGNANLWRPSPPQLHNNLIIHKRATPSFASFTVSPGESTCPTILACEPQQTRGRLPQASHQLCAATD